MSQSVQYSVSPGFQLHCLPATILESRKFSLCLYFPQPITTLKVFTALYTCDLGNGEMLCKMQEFRIQISENQKTRNHHAFEKQCKNKYLMHIVSCFNINRPGEAWVFLKTPLYFIN